TPASCQSADLWRIAGRSKKRLLHNATVAPSDVGDASMPDYASLSAEAIYPLAHGQTWAGQADDSFFLDLRVFDLLYGANFSEVGNDTLAGSNVQTIVLELPQSAVAENGDPAAHPIIGVWATAFRQSTRVQTSGGTESFS